MEKIYEKIPEFIRDNSKLAVATVISISGSTPREIGAKMIILPNGSIHGTIGGGKFEHLVISDAKEALNDGVCILKKYDLKPEDESGIGMECGGSVLVFIEVIKKNNQLLILGGGHIGLELYKMAILADFSVVVVDHRPEFVSNDRFPKAEKLLNCPVDDPRVLEMVDQNTYIVIITHEHKQDKLAVKSLINSDFRYLGMIGSKKKVTKTLRELISEGISKNKLEKIFTPIGLDIKSETPGEIAVSILAELINFKYTGEHSKISLCQNLEEMDA